jgi:hypothetical protein
MGTGYQVMSDDTTPPLLRWSAIFGGLLLGLALLLVLSALWLALAYGSGVTSVADHIAWFIGGSAIVALFVAGILTGYLSGVHGAGTGMLHGFALWALLIVATVTVRIPPVLNVFGLRQIADQAIGGPVGTFQVSALWASFWMLVGGFVAAGLGGTIGGLATRSTHREVVTVSAPTPAPQIVRTSDTDPATAWSLGSRITVGDGRPVEWSGSRAGRPSHANRGRPTEGARGMDEQS